MYYIIFLLSNTSSKFNKRTSYFGHGVTKLNLEVFAYNRDLLF